GAPLRPADGGLLDVAAARPGEQDREHPVELRELVPAPGAVEDAGAVAEPQLGAEAAAVVPALVVERARLAQLRLQGGAAGDERLQGALPALQHGRVHVPLQPLA